MVHFYNSICIWKHLRLHNVTSTPLGVSVSPTWMLVSVSDRVREKKKSAENPICLKNNRFFCKNNDNFCSCVCSAVDADCKCFTINLLQQSFSCRLSVLSLLNRYRTLGKSTKEREPVTHVHGCRSHAWLEWQRAVFKAQYSGFAKWFVLCLRSITKMILHAIQTDAGPQPLGGCDISTLDPEPFHMHCL